MVCQDMVRDGFVEAAQVRDVRALLINCHYLPLGCLTHGLRTDWFSEQFLM